MSTSDPRDKFGSIKGIMALMAFTIVIAFACIISAERFIWQMDDNRSLIQEQQQLFVLRNLLARVEELTLFEQIYAHTQNKEVRQRKDETVNNLLSLSLALGVAPGREDRFSQYRQGINSNVQNRIALDKDFYARIDSHAITDINSELAKTVAASKTIEDTIANFQSGIDRVREGHDSEMKLARAIVDQILTLLWMFVVVAGTMLARQAYVYVTEKRKMESLVRGAESRFREAERSSEEKAARLGAIFETAPVGIVTMGSDGKIESSNNAMLNIFGYAESELVSQSFALLVPNFMDVVSSLHKTENSMVVHHITDTTAIRKGGEKFHIQLALSLLALPSGPLVIGVIDDITPREEAQRKIRDFYSTVSHELRTPLTSIRTALSLMDAYDEEQQNPKMTPVLDIAQAELDRLIRLINDMLDIRKIEEGKLVLRLAKISVEALIQRATDGLQALASASNIQMEFFLKYKGKIVCDEDRIIQILTNLLSNAIKFSAANTTVRLEVEKVDNDCLFSVFDTGPGISDENLDRLFRKYEQLSLYDGKERAGTGLGLAIAKAITEEHHGSIGVDNTVQVGSRFWFRIPIEPIEAEEKPLEEKLDQLASVSGEKTLKR
jgi:PAS domain S-box-containing protein